MDKKKWVRPGLTVLTRGGDMSEKLLVACKSGGAGNWFSNAPNEAYGWCTVSSGPCNGCQSLVGTNS